MPLTDTGAPFSLPVPSSDQDSMDMYADYYKPAMASINANAVHKTASQTLTNKTLTNPVVGGSAQTAAGQFGFAGSKVTVGDGSASHTLVSEDQTQTLTNKTLTSPTITGTATISTNLAIGTTSVPGNPTGGMTVHGPFPQYQLRDSDLGVTAGGLWRLQGNGGSLTFEVNKAAGGDFGTVNAPLVLNDTTAAYSADLSGGATASLRVQNGLVANGAGVSSVVSGSTVAHNADSAAAGAISVFTARRSGTLKWTLALGASDEFVVFDNTGGAANLIVANSGAVATRGALQIGSRPAFVAGDKYLVVDASGNVHVSALGPAS